MSQTDRERWDERYREGPRVREPSAFLLQALQSLPTSGRALDVAGGTGRHALALARHGLEVTLVDVSRVGLGHAARRADEAGLALTLTELDLEAVDASSFPPGPWDLIVGCHYLWRELPALAASALGPGGLLLYCHPTVRNLERHERPPQRFLLQEGELAELVDAVPELEVVSLEEGWLEDRHEARVIARRKG